MKEKINFNFTYFALKTLGNNLYSNPWVAVSELVANGLDAGATKVKILIDMRDKNYATIEIMDNGSGMSYDDLAEKYAIIGRNKRETENSDKLLGRKGVGKLATLYLTPHFFISTKTGNEHTTWEINTSKYKDSDIPGLERISNDGIQYLGQSEWQNFKTGTILKLIDVNLHSIGQEKIKSLKAILADYYSADSFQENIEVAIIDKDSRSIVFEKIDKRVYFDAFYAIFDNTGKHLGQIKDTVYLTDEDDLYPEIDYPRETLKYDDKNFNTKGTITMKNLDGDFVTVPYELKGWIAVNCSLKETIQKRNSKNYKKLTYRGNELKLYVRGKLAVADLMKYINSTHAISNYIEGEISFDVLDKNDLEDIATSNREGYKLDDPRVQKLISIVKPIVNKLINDRAEIGSTIKLQNDNLRKAKEEDAAKIKQGKERVEEELERIFKEKKDIEAKNAIANKRLFVLERNFIGSGEHYKNGMHLAVNYAKAIKSKAIKLSRNAPRNETVHLADIAGYSENIIRLNKMLGKAKFSLNSTQIKENLFTFIKDYVKIISTSSLNCEFVFDVPSYETEFDFCEMSMVIENIISNSKKAGAKKLIISSYKIDDKTILEFKDNGRGLDPSIKDVNVIFELGYTTTGGYGIGCYFINKILSKISSCIKIKSDHGFHIIVELI